MKKIVMLILFSLSIASGEFAEGVFRKPSLRNFSKQWYVPDWAKVQYGGYLGFVSVGVGYRSLLEYANIDIFYGFTPKGLPNVYSTVHTAALKITIPFKTIQISSEYEWGMSVGSNLALSFGENILRFNQPEYYPDDYYREQFFHAIPFVGTRLIKKNSRVKRVRAVELYMELCLLDDYLWYGMSNESVKLSSSLGASVGFVWYFIKDPRG